MRASRLHYKIARSSHFARFTLRSYRVKFYRIGFLPFTAEPNVHTPFDFTFLQKVNVNFHLQSIPAQPPQIEATATRRALLDFPKFFDLLTLQESRKHRLVEAIKLKGQKTVTAAWYTSHCLPGVLQTLRVGGLMLHHDNTFSNNAALAVNFLRENNIVVL
ncbi:hypothetical protein EVAR_37265_1 [Eumeta japonica]|uniref:Uncharacterized protein n=1 Tax=Eumeta variegata TaxID=151549 RepID=A0A4C1WM88_EUMVA|nr:hypothetical protein EVAR_37265_1 [Eumeta japonica]